MVVKDNTYHCNFTMSKNLENIIYLLICWQVIINTPICCLCVTIMPTSRSVLCTLSSLPSDSARGSERQDFLSEIDMMKMISEGHNPNVIGMVGCVTLQEPLSLILEYVTYGDLLSYLRMNMRMVLLKCLVRIDMLLL